MDGEISLKRDDPADAAVRFQGYVLALPASNLVDDAEKEAVLGGGEAVFGDGEAVDSDSDQDDDADSSCPCERCQQARHADEDQRSEFQQEESYDSDEESDGEVDVPLEIDGGAARASGGPLQLIRRNFVFEGRFLGPAPRFASAGNTAGIMRVAAVEPDVAAGSQQGGRKQILVLYRYTRFSTACNGRKGVEVCRSTKLHQLRFVVPPAGDTASSLPWAGSSLAPLIYPSRFSRELQALWSALISTVSIPPRSTRIQVIVDAGILTRGDYTPRRMASMRAALEGMMEEPWPGYHVGMELHLPEPMRCADEGEADDNDTGDGERAAKRRKVVAEQECPVCFEQLESGVVAWPGCSLPHVFHGVCLELSLKESEMCPLCRRRLSSPLEVQS